MKKLLLTQLVIVTILILLGLLDRIAFINGVAGIIGGFLAGYMIFGRKKPSNA